MNGAVGGVVPWVVRSGVVVRLGMLGGLVLVLLCWWSSCMIDVASAGFVLTMEVMMAEMSVGAGVVLVGVVFVGVTSSVVSSVVAV